MNKIFSKSIKYLLFIALVMSFIGVRPVQATEIDPVEAENLVEGIVTVENSQLNYSATMETLYADTNAGIYSYKVYEYGKELNIIIDTVDEKYIINDIVLTSDQYNQLIEEQANILSSSAKTRSNIDGDIVSLSEKYNNQSDDTIQAKYDFKHQVYVADSLTHEDDHAIGNPLLRCTFCPLKTVNVPTTNYQSKWYYTGIYTQSMVVSMSATAVAAVASYATHGDKGKAKILISAALGFVTGAVSVSAAVKYDRYIAYHNVCPKANKEKRISYLTVKGNKTVAQTTYAYWYAVKPY